MLPCLPLNGHRRSRRSHLTGWPHGVLPRRLALHANAAMRAPAPTAWRWRSQSEAMRRVSVAKYARLRTEFADREDRMKDETHKIKSVSAEARRRSQHAAALACGECDWLTQCIQVQLAARASKQAHPSQQDHE